MTHRKKPERVPHRKSARVVQLPKPINLFGIKKVFFSTPELMLHFIANDPSFQRPTENARIASRLEKSLKKISGTRWIIPNESDWEFLCKILENPQCGNPMWDVSAPPPGAPKETPPVTQRYTVTTSVLLPLIDPVVAAKIYKSR